MSFSQTRCSKRPFRKFAYPWDSRENVETCTEEEEQVPTKVFKLETFAITHP
jgi:hypothetical protein